MASGSIRERKTKKGTSYQLTIEAGVDPITGELEMSRKVQSKNPQKRW